MQEIKLIQADSFLTLHYRLTTQDGEEVVSTFDLGPATIQMGHGELNENLESCLVGLQPGEHAILMCPLKPALVSIIRAWYNVLRSVRCP